MSNLQFTSDIYYFIFMLWIIFYWNYSKFVKTKSIFIFFSFSFQTFDRQIHILWISISSFITRILKIFHSIRNFPYLFLKLNSHYSKLFLSLLVYSIILLFTLFFTFSKIYLRDELWYMYIRMIMNVWKR